MLNYSEYASQLKLITKAVISLTYLISSINRPKAYGVKIKDWGTWGKTWSSSNDVRRNIWNGYEHA